MADDSLLAFPLSPSTCEKDAKILQFLEEITRIVDAVQQSVLDEILIRNSQIEYLSDRLTFISNIPIVTYEDLQIQQTKYNLDPFSNHFFNSHFRITSKQIKESTVNEYMIVFVSHRQSQSSTKSVQFTSKSQSIISKFSSLMETIANQSDSL
ncbi:hypothetical protein R3W88_023119 [Solanum pinnatisectum]|uniref:Uncharacterized protein n=1 Tax=Solanum pinnatisectum TaxID=50273 RepID=A0AAV9LWM0_9SOLN|nr:hypothetical protein R3W88_023119 [Solanum pinnatisectum]